METFFLCVSHTDNKVVKTISFHMDPQKNTKNAELYKPGDVTLYRNAKCLRTYL